MYLFRKQNIYLCRIIVVLFLLASLSAVTSCDKNDKKLKYGIYRCANGMEVVLRETDLEVRNFDFSDEEKYFEEFALMHHYKKDGEVTLSEEEETKIREKIDKEIDLNGRFLNKKNNYTYDIIDKEGEKTIGIYSKINEETCYFYMEYHPINDTLTYECFNGTILLLEYKGPEP